MAATPGWVVTGLFPVIPVKGRPCVPPWLLKGGVAMLMKKNKVSVMAGRGKLKYFSDDQGLTWSPYLVDDQHLRYGDGERTWLVDHTGKVVGGELKPSSEVRIHLAAYRLRKEVCAVIHAHPCAVVAHSMVGAPLVPAFNPEVLAAVGPIAEVEYEASGSAALAALFEDVLADHNTFIMARHGAVTLGLDLEHAYDRLEMLEQTAQMQVMAGCLSP